MFAFETMLEMNSWKAATDDAKTLFLQNRDGSCSSSVAESLTVGCYWIF